MFGFTPRGRLSENDAGLRGVAVIHLPL